MRTSIATRLGKHAAWTLGLALIFAHDAAQACAGCKQSMTPGADGTTPPLNGASLGFGLSIFFMIFMVAALIGGLGFMMYRSCQAIAARQDAELARTEAGEAVLAGLPAQA